MISIREVIKLLDIEEFKKDFSKQFSGLPLPPDFNPENLYYTKSDNLYYDLSKSSEPLTL
jgi:hypothetical protein